MRGILQVTGLIRSTSNRWWLMGLLGVVGLVAFGPFVGAGCEQPLHSQALQARLELAAGMVEVSSGDQKVQAFSGSALLPGAKLRTGEGARALIRLSDGASVFMGSGSEIELGNGEVSLLAGEVWFDAPPTERETTAMVIGPVRIDAVDAGLSVRRGDGGSSVYAARGLVTVTAPGGRAELQAGERAVISGDQEPKVEPVSFWEDWTGGMADHPMVGMLAGVGSGRIYGVDIHSAGGTSASALEISRQSVRAVIRSQLAETEVDQTFFNPQDRAVEGWYWFAVPDGASVTGFAVETNGQLVEGEFIERREAARQYGQAVASGHAPALLEWIDENTFRARIYPVPPTGTRRVVLRYLQLLPVSEGVMRYVYPLQAAEPIRIGEFSLSVDLGPEGQQMAITTLADARIEPGRQLVTMRRSGYTPRADFMLEARLEDQPDPMRVARASAGTDSADYLMLRYTPDVDWNQAKDLKGEVVLVVDTSAAGDDANRAMKAAAAEALLRALSNGDRFALVSLDVRPTVLHPAKDLAEVSEASISKALEQLAEHSEGGATDLSAMFDVALGRLHGCQQPAVIYVGDGLATSGETDGQALTERLRRSLATSRARLFTVGVGPQANRQLMTSLAEAGGGQFFHIGSDQETTQRALELVAALKTPTLTDFEIDLGAGLDEVFVSANGKVKNGDQVVVLARTHHDLPSTIGVKGQLAGQPFEKSYGIDRDESIVAAFVPRLWAAEYLRRLLVSTEDPTLTRGKIMQLGIEYGLMTPYTSILALESEAAYHQQGIPRRQSPLRGVRLSDLDADRAGDGLQRTINTVGYGCAVQSDQEAPATAAREEAARDVYGHKSLKGLGQAAPQPAPSIAPVVGGGGRQNEGLVRGMAAAEVAEDRVDDLSAGAKPTEELEMKKQLGDSARASRPTRANRPAQVVQTCSDASRRPLRQRVIMWRKRFRTAQGAQDLIHRYQAALYACELSDWRSESTFFRVMQPFISDEGTAIYVLQFFAAQPDTQRFVARLILRRAVDPRVIAAVENVLFKGQINWANVDIELSELASTEARIERLRQVLARAPDDPKGIIRLVHQLVQAGRMDEAMVQGRRLRDSGLTTPFLSRELGDLLAENERADEAVRTYSEIVEFDPDNQKSRLLLGDIYLSHGWYEPAYSQYKLLNEQAQDEALYKMRLAASAAGAGRVDEALRLERQVAREPGRPGPDDPRRWARLWSAARLARMISEPPKEGDAARIKKSLESRLKELQLFRGPGTLVLLTWEDMSADLTLATEAGGRAVASGELSDAAKVGLAATLLATEDLEGLTLKAYRRNSGGKVPIAMRRHDVRWDGKTFSIRVQPVLLPAGASGVDL